MDKKTIIKISIAAIFGLWLIFSDVGFKEKVVTCLVIGAGYQVYNRAKAQQSLHKTAQQGMDDLITQNNFKADYQHFHADGNQVSGIAISKEDPRVILVSSAVPAKLFNRSEIISIDSETTKEQDVQFKMVSATGAGDRKVNKTVHIVDIAVKDLDTPRYKLYFENAEVMLQWKNRLGAWLNMQSAS